MRRAPIVITATVAGLARTADGTPQASAFVVTFDRPIDANTFSVQDVQVFFRDTFPGNPTGGPVPVVNVPALDLNHGGAGFGPEAGRAGGYPHRQLRPVENGFPHEIGQRYFGSGDQPQILPDHQFSFCNISCFMQ